MHLPVNKTQAECFIDLSDLPILFLIGERSFILANIIAKTFLMLTAIWGNVSILLSFALVPPLRSTSNYLLFGLALTDLGVGILVHPFHIFLLYSLYNNSIPNCNIMAAFSVVTSYFAATSLSYMTVIGTERYLAIRLHLKYQQIVTEKRAIILQITIWIINVLLPLVWLKGFRVFSTFSAVCVTVSLLISSAVYMKMFQVVKRHRKQIHNQMESQMGQFKFSRLKRLQKSAINTLYVFFTFLICYLPFFTTVAIVNMSTSPMKAAMLAFEISTTIMLSNSSINPLVYCLRLREFKNAVKKTYRRLFCLQMHSDVISRELEFNTRSVGGRSLTNTHPLELKDVL